MILHEVQGKPRKMYNFKFSWKVPAVNGSKEPIAILKDGKCVNRHGNHHKDEVKHGQGHQQPVKGVFPQLKELVT